MKEELIKNIAGIVEYIKQGADFVKEQAPLFIQEYLTFKTYLFLFWDISLIILSIVGGWYCRKCYKKLQSDDISYGDEDFYIMLMFVSGAICVGGLIGFICCSEELIKIIYAPRVFLVDHLLSSN